MHVAFASVEDCEQQLSPESLLWVLPSFCSFPVTAASPKAIHALWGSMSVEKQALSDASS